MKQIMVMIQVNDAFEETADRAVERFTDAMMRHHVAASVGTQEWPEWFQHAEITKKAGCKHD